jgi:hypothetical protein
MYLPKINVNVILSHKHIYLGLPCSHFPFDPPPPPTTTNEIKIVKTFSDDIKMKFRLEKCARISLKNETVYRKQHIRNMMEN